MTMVVESLLEGNAADAIRLQHLWTRISCSAHLTGLKAELDGLCLECNTAPPRRDGTFAGLSPVRGVLRAV